MGNVDASNHGYNHPLLIQLEDKFTGAMIGCIRIPHVTVADDLTEMTHSHDASDVTGVWWLRQWCTVCDSPNQKLYPGKHQEDGYTMNGVEMSQVQHLNHLGIHMDSSNKANITEKVNLERRIVYSFLGAGLHCGNGQKQSVCGKLWSIYVVPRLLYSLEVLELTGNDIKVLEQYQRKSLMQIQSLPDKTHSSAVLTLLGILPLKRSSIRSCLTYLVD